MDDFDALVARSVVNDGYGGAISVEGGADQMGSVGGGDKVDVVYPLILQPFDQVDKVCRRTHSAAGDAADCNVLTIAAAHRASAEKDRTASALSRDRRLFVKMGRGAIDRDAVGGGQTGAEAGGAIDVTTIGTKIADQNGLPVTASVINAKMPIPTTCPPR